MSRVAILHPGEMGAALAARLATQGIECTAVLAGRGEATRRRAAAAGMTACADVGEAVRGAALIVSLVPARAAEMVAAEVAAHVTAPGGRRWTAATGPLSTRPPIYLDANSVDLRVARRVGAVAAGAGLRPVDGAFIGPANRLDRDTTLLLSGPEAAEAAALIGPAVTLRVVGTELGHASALKLAISVVTKGLVALTLETLAAAEAVGARADAAALLERLYPGVWEVARRVLPTYPRHIGRRRAEVADAADWIESEGLAAPMARATEAVFAGLEAAGLDPKRGWTFEAVLDALNERE